MSLTVSVQNGTKSGWRRRRALYPWRCPGCKASLDKHWSRCPNCGTERP
jgi:rRNA maturation endonuclease Nob1